ncbi:glycosyltransferase [Planctomycetota bacterium]|nr:glycosyltransferase [Planctomycetota bacterium]
MEQVTVILPVYNEAGLISSVFNRIQDFLHKHDGYEFLFVNDGSTDATGDILQDRIDRSEVGDRVSVVSLKENVGKGVAVREGVSLCDTEIVCFTDGDLAYSLDHVVRLVEALEGSDVAIGSRSMVPLRQRNITLGRKIMGKVFNKVVRLILGLPYKDTQAGIKGFRLETARKIFSYQRLGGFAFDAELLFLAQRHGCRVIEIPASVSKSHSYKISKMNLWLEPMRMLKALLHVRMNSLMGKYSHENTTEFRCGRVRHSGGVRTSDT